MKLLLHLVPRSTPRARPLECLVHWSSRGGDWLEDFDPTDAAERFLQIGNAEPPGAGEYQTDARARVMRVPIRFITHFDSDDEPIGPEYLVTVSEAP